MNQHHLLVGIVSKMKLPYTRYVKQGRTNQPVSTTAMESATQQAYNAMLASPWRKVTEKQSGLPRHNWAQSGFSDQWDAAKYCGDYAEGYQHAYATAVCYVFRMPQDALDGTVAQVETVSLPIYGDRWLAEGVDVKVSLSNSGIPPLISDSGEWEELAQLSVVPNNTGEDSFAELVLSPQTEAKRYLYVILHLTGYLTRRGAWIEGGAMLDGAGVSIGFDRVVELDDDCPTFAVSGVTVDENGVEVSVDGWDMAFVGSGLPVLRDGLNYYDKSVEWTRAIANFANHATQAKKPITTGGSLAMGGYLQLSGDRIPQAIGTTRLFMVPPTSGRILNKLVFSDPIPATDGRMGALVVLYVLSSSAVGEIPELDEATYTSPDFWGGLATSIVIGGNTMPVEPILKLQVDDEPIGAEHGVSYKSDTSKAILCAVSLNRFCGSPGFEIGAEYGLLWQPKTLIITEG